MSDKPASSKVVVDPEPEPAASLSGGWGTFIVRLAKVMVRPSAFWLALRQGGTPKISEVVWPHLVVLILLRSVADLVGGLLHSDLDFVDAGARAAVAGAGWLLLPLGLAVAASIIGGASGGTASFRRSLAYAAYGLAPMFVAGSLAVVPVLWVARAAEMIAMPYTFYVLAVGAVPMLAIERERVAGAVGLINGVVVLLWSAVALLSAWMLEGPAAQVVP